MDIEQLIQSFNPVMDTAGEVYIHVCPKGEDTPQPIPHDCPTARNVIKAELSRVLGGRLPTDHQTRSFMEMLCGHAFLGGRETPELGLEYLLARDPVAQAVHAIHKKGGTKQSTKPLLAMLVRIAQREGIDTRKGNWPVNEDALGKRLSMLMKPFASHGIELTYHHNLRPREWTIPPWVPKSGGSGVQVTDENAEHARTNATADTSNPAPETAGEVAENSVQVAEGTQAVQEPHESSDHDTYQEIDEVCTLTDDDIKGLMQEE